MGGEYLFKLECQGLRLLAERKSPVKCSVRAITRSIFGEVGQTEHAH